MNLHCFNPTQKYTYFEVDVMKHNAFLNEKKKKCLDLIDTPSLLNYKFTTFCFWGMQLNMHKYSMNKFFIDLSRFRNFRRKNINKAS